MFTPNKFKSSNQNSFMESAHWFATTLAVIGTVLIVPLVWAQIDEQVKSLTTQYYSSGFASLAYLVVKLGAYPVCFFLLRMSLVTAFVSMAVGFAVRFV